MHVVEQVLAELDLADRPILPVFNKIDAVPDPAGFAARVRELHPGAITTTTSAPTDCCRSRRCSASWSAAADRRFVCVSP